MKNRVKERVDESVLRLKQRKIIGLLKGYTRRRVVWEVFYGVSREKGGLIKRMVTLKKKKKKKIWMVHDRNE